MLRRRCAVAFALHALQATLAGHLHANLSTSPAVTGCELREYASAAYFFQAGNPFEIEPALLRFNDSTCAAPASQPLGGLRVAVLHAERAQKDSTIAVPLVRVDE